MAKGMSLHIGINRVDPAAYAGWAGPLRGCEFDAKDLQRVCAANGFSTQMLLTSEAIADAVLASIDEAADDARDGDVFVVTYSGHGGQRPDADDEEPDGRDETWVLFDRQLLDDELYERWASFPAGARVVVVSDSCHSGSVIKATLDAYREAQDGVGAALPAIFEGARAMPAEVNDGDNKRRHMLYQTVKARATDERDVQLAARVLLLSGCQDNQTSADGARNGRFTGAVLAVWSDGAFTGGYKRLFATVKRRMPPWQSPNLMVLNDPLDAFTRERPFTVEPRLG